jgi:hypothetical protein
MPPSSPGRAGAAGHEAAGLTEDGIGEEPGLLKAAGAGYLPGTLADHAQDAGGIELVSRGVRDPQKHVDVPGQASPVMVFQGLEAGRPVAGEEQPGRSRRAQVCSRTARAPAASSSAGSVMPACRAAATAPIEAWSWARP